MSRSHLAGCSLAALVLLLTSASAVSAQYPRARAGQFEVRGLDFRRDGAWRKRTGAIRHQRQALLASGQFAVLNISGANPAAPAVAGNYRIPVVPIRYANTDMLTLFPIAQYDELFFSAAPAGRPYNLRTYYEQLSSGMITSAGTVFPWVGVDSSDVYYEDGCNGVGVWSR